MAGAIGPGMNVGLYQGAAAMQSLEQWQEAVSQNLASANVPGYKGTARRTSTPCMSAGQPSNLNAAGPAAATARRCPRPTLRSDLTQGELRSTGQAENLAIEGAGLLPGAGRRTVRPRTPATASSTATPRATLVTKSGLSPSSVEERRAAFTLDMPKRVTSPSGPTARSPRATTQVGKRRRFPVQGPGARAATQRRAVPPRRTSDSGPPLSSSPRSPPGSSSRQQRLHPALDGRSHHRPACLRGQPEGH